MKKFKITKCETRKYCEYYVYDVYADSPEEACEKLEKGEFEDVYFEDAIPEGNMEDLGIIEVEEV